MRNEGEKTVSHKQTLLDRIRLEVKLSSENSKKEQLFLIYNYLKDTNECIEITVRKFLQVEHLVQDMSEKYGGFVIPVLDINNTFSPQAEPRALPLPYRRIPKRSDQKRALRQRPQIV